jgi:hypothetical protein
MALRSQPFEGVLTASVACHKLLAFLPEPFFFE